MIYSNNCINILTAIQYKGIGRAWIVSNWREKLQADDIVEMINKSTTGEKTSVQEFNDIRQNVINSVESQDSFADGLVGWGDGQYPFCRGNAKRGDFPVALFYKGDIQLLSSIHQNVAVIGVLKPEEAVIQREQKMVSALLKHNYVIVSGLALGCDSVAHRQTLDESGKTVAVLPSPLSNIVPAQHKELAEQIVRNNGLLVTEYYENPKSQLEMRSRYQERDRLQAMFSDAIILTASYDVNKDGNDSGSRLAMEYARQYKISRYVMYNEQLDLKNPQFDLNRRILKEGDSQILTQSRISILTQKQTSQLDLF